VPFERCRVWPGGTGMALRDWLRTKGYEPESFQLP
jgi:NAD+ diphosphatase